MATDEQAALIDGEKRLGTVTKVGASGIDLNLPQALAAAGRRGVARGTVGDFVFIDCDRVAILGRITEVLVPEQKRPELERQVEREPNAEPVGRVQLLASIRKTTQAVDRGVLVSPRVGDGVFEANGSALSRSLQEALFASVKHEDEQNPVAVSLGRISRIEADDIAIPPENLFARHCGVFGATGGGKSWTMAKLIAEVDRLGGKAIVFDPTGEFSGKPPDAVEYAFTSAEHDQKLVRFPAEQMTEPSLFTLLRPTGQSQMPTMREAIRSLRLARALSKDKNLSSLRTGSGLQYQHASFGTVFVEDRGTILKTGQSIVNFGKATKRYDKEIASELCDFDIHCLPHQLVNECIWPTSRNNMQQFGRLNESTLLYCNSLIVRASGMLASDELQCFFGNQGEDFHESLNAFLNDTHRRVCLISFKSVSFNHNARELLLNTIGEHLLRLARRNRFREQPVICFLDEAHQFMGRSVGDEFNSVALDAFGLIAKEGRKYGLTTVLSTQRPRDVPQDVLSQLGTLFVHRLTNERDRETIERACGDLDRSAAAFIPSLSQGEAILLGPDLPAPLPIQITPPNQSARPTSSGPNYQRAWSPKSNSK